MNRNRYLNRKQEQDQVKNWQTKSNNLKMGRRDDQANVLVAVSYRCFIGPRALDTPSAHTHRTRDVLINRQRYL